MMRLSMIAAALGSLTQAVQAAPPTRLFKVGGGTITGTPKTICVLEGKWSDRESWRYEAWDTCARMRILRVSRSALQGVVPLGSRKDTVLADIPASAELFEIANTTSRVIIFRDQQGRLREIMTGD
jgi:hypothetical protein